MTVKRPHIITFRLSEQEREDLMRRAGEAGLDLSEYVRSRVAKAPLVLHLGKSVGVEPLAGWWVASPDLQLNAQTLTIRHD